MTDLEMLVRDIVRDEFQRLIRIGRGRTPCARPGCTKTTQTAFPLCASCRAGHRPDWQDPRVKKRGAA